MAHPLVEQLRFTRREFQRDLEGLSDEDAVKRVGPANCIAWNISHLAWQEQRYWLLRGQGGHAPPGASTSSSPPEPPPARRLGHLAPLCTLKPRWRSNPPPFLFLPPAPPGAIPVMPLSPARAKLAPV
jgi:DinB superfamily